MSRRNPWIDDADKLLDVDWRDGLEWVLEVEKEIPAGVAQRAQEGRRVRAIVRRERRAREKMVGRPLTEGELRQIEVRERVRALSTPAQIAAGKRGLVIDLVHSRVRYGTYEVDPWPIPEAGWQAGGWRIRRPRRWSPTALQQRFHLQQETLRDLILQQPPLPHFMIGRLMFLADDALPRLEERVTDHRKGSSDRRRQASKRRWEQQRSQPATHVSLTTLAQAANMAVESARMLCEANPDLDWQHRGRVVRLPVGQVPAWEKIVAEYKRGPRRKPRGPINSP